MKFLNENGQQSVSDKLNKKLFNDNAFEFTTNLLAFVKAGDHIGFNFMHTVAFTNKANNIVSLVKSNYKEDAEGEVSESFVNFEDVRINVENKMQDEVNKSIKECDNAKTEYLARKDQLDKEKDKIIQKYKEECYKQLEARFDQQITGLKYNLTEQSGKVSHLQGVIDTKDEEIAKLKEEIEALTKKKSHWWD